MIGFLPDEISGCLEVLAAILNLGNATFTGYSLPDGSDACKLENVTGRWVWQRGHVTGVGVAMRHVTRVGVARRSCDRDGCGNVQWIPCLILLQL